MSPRKGSGLGMSNFGDTESQLKADLGPPETRRQAALTTCHYADTTDEAREFLAMLGLLEDPDVT
jgi:hypothetical protein